MDVSFILMLTITLYKRKMDKFDPVFGSGRIRSPFFIALILLITLASAFLMAKGGLIISIMLMVLPLGLIILNRIFNAPYIGFIIVFFANFFMLGINRYIPGPLGLTIDGLLILTYLSLFFRSFNQPVNWSLQSLISLYWQAFGLGIHFSNWLIRKLFRVQPG